MPINPEAPKAPNPFEGQIEKQKGGIEQHTTDDPLGGMEMVPEHPTYQFEEIIYTDTNDNNKIDANDGFVRLEIDENGNQQRVILDSKEGYQELQSILKDKYHIKNPAAKNKLAQVYQFAHGVAQYNKTIGEIEEYLADPNVDITAYGDTFTASLDEAVAEMSSASKKLGNKALGKEGKSFLASAKTYIQQEVPETLKPTERKEVT